jgi:hypothetical protein
MENQRWGAVGDVDLVDGKNVIRLSSDHVFPHILTLRFTRI